MRIETVEQLNDPSNWSMIVTPVETTVIEIVRIDLTDEEIEKGRKAIIDHDHASTVDAPRQSDGSIRLVSIWIHNHTTPLTIRPEIPDTSRPLNQIISQS